MCPIELAPGESWVIEKKNATTGAWEVIKSSTDPGNPQPCIMQEACAELRFRLTSSPIDAVDRCEALAAIEKVKEVQFAPFEVDWLCVATIPTNRRRSTIGLGEEVAVWVFPSSAGAAEWSVSSHLQLLELPDGFRSITAFVPGSAEVSVTINGCVRKISFEIILPASVNYTKCPLSVRHTQGSINLAYSMWMDFDPDSVSFYNVEFREVAGPAINVTGVFTNTQLYDTYHYASLTALRPDMDNVFRPAADIVGTGPIPWDPGVGGYEWHIPIDVRKVGST